MNTRGRTRSRSRRGAVLIVALLAGYAHTTLVAQEATATPPDTAAHTPNRRFFTRRDAMIAAGFTAATIAAFPLDRQTALELQEPETQTNRFFKRASTGVELIASPGAYIIGGTIYAVGRIGHFERLADFGWHGTEAVLLGDGITLVLKGFLGRARPFVSRDTNPADFAFGGGFGNEQRTSFPSGHTTTAFSAASAVTAEASRWWPKSVWVVAPLMYGGATLVGLSRMYHDRHWASDVALGAAIGTFSGLKVVDYAHRNPKNRIDRIMLHATVVPVAGGGAALVVPAFQW